MNAATITCQIYIVQASRSLSNLVERAHGDYLRGDRDIPSAWLIDLWKHQTPEIKNAVAANLAKGNRTDIFRWIEKLIDQDVNG